MTTTTTIDKSKVEVISPKVTQALALRSLGIKLNDALFLKDMIELEKSMTVPELRAYFRELIKRAGVEK